MQIITYTNIAEVIRVDKSSYLSNASEFSNEVKMEGGQDIQNPTFLFTSPSEPQWNYVYISDFNRYYYVTNIVWLSNNMWQITCAEDVLMSNKNKILELTGVATRLEDAERGYILDDKLTVENERYDDFDVIEVQPVDNNLKFDLHPAGTNTQNILFSAYSGETPTSESGIQIIFNPAQVSYAPTFSEDVYTYAGTYYTNNVTVYGNAEYHILYGFPQFDVYLNDIPVTYQSVNLEQTINLNAGQTNVIKVKVYYLYGSRPTKTYTYTLTPNTTE